MPTREELNKGFRIGDWEVWPARGELRRGDEVVQPEPKVLGVLLSLAARNGDVVTKDELVDEVWDGRATADDPIIRCVYQLRGHLGDKDKPYRYVDTLVRRGYCLKQAVVLLEATAATAAPATERPGKMSRRRAAAAVVLALSIAGFLFWKALDQPDSGIHSIAVLPFENLTGDAANAYLASGFKEELVHTLQNIPQLAVKNSHVDYAGLEIPEIGLRLGVDSLLIGAVRRVGDELRFSYQVARAADGVNVSSGQVKGRVEEVFLLQEELAGMVRRHLVGDSGRALLSSSRPASFDAYERYLRGLFAFERRGVPGNLEDAIALFEESIRLDPNYGPAYLALAEIYALLPDYRGAPLAESHAQAIRIVEQGIAADPAIRYAAAAVFGFVYHKQKRWAEAETAFIRATTAPVVESNAFNWYSLMLGSVGRLDAALQQALAALELDPSSAVINSRVAIVYTWMDDAAKAEEFFERSKQLGAGGSTHLLAHALFLARQGRFEQARNLANAGMRIRGGATDWIDPVIEALGDPGQRDVALAALGQASDAGQLRPQIEVTLRMMLGDADGTLRLARMLVQPGETIEMELLFLPEFLALRERPEFLELMAALGVTDYWKQAGCAWQELAVRCH